jgi:hypothetical protein
METTEMLLQRIQGRPEQFQDVLPLPELVERASASEGWLTERRRTANRRRSGQVGMSYPGSE